MKLLGLLEIYEKHQRYKKIENSDVNRRLLVYISSVLSPNFVGRAKNC